MDAKEPIYLLKGSETSERDVIHRVFVAFLRLVSTILRPPTPLP